MPRSCLRAALAVGLALSAAPASAAPASAAPAPADELSVHPVQVDLAPTAPTALLHVENTSDVPQVLHLSTLAWDLPGEEAPYLVESDDVVAYPSTLRLAPGESRALRVRARRGFGAVEGSYRIVIEPWPAGEGEPVSAGLIGASRVSVPVFLEPAAIVDAVELRVDVDGGLVDLEVENRGTRRLRIDEVEVVTLDAEGEVLWETRFPGWYVLAGRTRPDRVELPVEGCAAIARVAVVVSTDLGVLGSELDLPGLAGAATCPAEHAPPPPAPPEEPDQGPPALAWSGSQP